MLCVKITAFLIILTIIGGAIVKSFLELESPTVQLKMAMNNEYPPYVIAFGLLCIIDVIGVICSAFWFLFLR